MSKIELNVLFKKLQRDDKKEVLDFHVMGEKLERSDELVLMAGNMVLLNIESSQAGEIPAEFKSIQRDSKKTVLKFEAKGDSQDQIIKLYPFAGNNVNLTIEESQMSLEEFEEQHEGIEYSISHDGTASVTHPDQVTMDDVDNTEFPFSDEDPDDLLN